MADWYKRAPRDALNGMRDLTLEERGCYDAALDLIYEEEGPILQAALKRELGIRDGRTLTRLITSLVTKGKLILLNDGRLHNGRAMFEISQLHADASERARAGSKGGRKRALRAAKQAMAGQGEMFGQSANSTATQPEKPSNINGSAQAQLDHGRAHARGMTAADHELALSSGQVDHKLTQLEGDCSATGAENANDFNATPQAELKHIDTDIEEESPPLVPPDEKPRLKSKRAQPMPPLWEPPPKTDYLTDLTATWSDDEWAQEVEKFKAHATANGRTCKDWNAAWLHWAISAAQYRERRQGNGERSSGWRFS